MKMSIISFWEEPKLIADAEGPLLSFHDGDCALNTCKTDLYLSAMQL